MTEGLRPARYEGLAALVDGNVWTLSRKRGSLEWIFLKGVAIEGLEVLPRKVHTCGVRVARG